MRIHFSECHGTQILNERRGRHVFASRVTSITLRYYCLYKKTVAIFTGIILMSDIGAMEFAGSGQQQAQTMRTAGHRRAHGSEKHGKYSDQIGSYMA